VRWSADNEQFTKGDETMKAKNAEGKLIKNYKNPMLPLMPAPQAVYKEDVPMMICGFCGGRDVVKGKAVKINGIRVHPQHKACIKSVKRPLFDMSENKFQIKS
jgi:hypothetical protein